jgi:hypothetical protein
MTTILAVIDGSEVAGTVLAVTRALALITGAAPEALFVRENDEEAPRLAAEENGIPLREVTGDVVEQLLTAAREPDVATIVIGAGHSDDDESAGHVCLALLPQVTKPIVVVPSVVKPPITLRRMVVPLDGTTSSARNVHPALELAASAELEMVVLHVCDEDRIPPFADQTHHYAEAFAQEFVARYAPSTTAQLELRFGTPADEVLTAAVALHADILALSWSQVLDEGRAQVVKHLLAESPVPLLLLPSS